MRVLPQPAGPQMLRVRFVDLTNCGGRRRGESCSLRYLRYPVRAACKSRANRSYLPGLLGCVSRFQSANACTDNDGPAGTQFTLRNRRFGRAVSCRLPPLSVKRLNRSAIFDRITSDYFRPANPAEPAIHFENFLRVKSLRYLFVRKPTKQEKSIWFRDTD
jgi:hypothetical protein